MGYIKIKDSGYVKPNNSGTQASASYRSRTGTTITIKAAEFVPELKRNIAVNPELGKSFGTALPSEVNLGTLENMQFSLRCVLNSRTATDIELVQYLIECVKTNGYKLLWYDYTSAAEQNNGQLIYQLAYHSHFGHVFTAGEMSAWSISTAFYHLHVLFTEIIPRQSTENLIIYELKGVVLPVNTDTTQNPTA
jgi:hypothetical protein